MDAKEMQEVAILAAEKVLADAAIAKSLKGERTSIDSRVNMLQYINTFMLGIVAVVAVLIFNTTNKVRDSQSDAAVELIRLKTVQNINVTNIDQVDTRVTSLELNYVDLMKTWVEANFVRKAGK